MGSKRWHLASRKKPRGRLDQTDRFLAGPAPLAACSLTVPIEMDPKAAVLAAGGLAGSKIRSFELWWDAGEKKMEIVLVAEERDLTAYRQAFLSMYPNTTFADMKHTVPEWFDENETCQIFDVGTYHGHYPAVFDKARAHQLMTQIANTIQLSQSAWIQFVFRQYPFVPFLRRHVGRLDSRAREIRRGRYLSNTEIIMNPDKKPHEHPEMGYDFINSYAGLQKHATLKMQAVQVMMSIRGVIRGNEDVDLNFDDIEALPVESVHSNHEHLTKFRYKYEKFHSENPKKTGIKIKDSRERMQRMGIFAGRLLPDPEHALGSVMDRYFDKGIFGYREREPLPFLILNLTEIPILIHLPDPMVPNLDTTRGVTLPVKPSRKEGSCLGHFRPDAGDEYRWGQMIRSHDAGAAVISPADFATHIYAVGASGSGKTSLIRLFAKHLEAWNGGGTAVMPNAFVYVDPKGDDSHKFVRQCEQDTVSDQRVHFLDPQETRFSINPLELPPHSPWEREEVVSRYVGYFMKTIEEWYQQSASFVQMERIFRALLFYIYMRHDAPTFLDIHDIVLRLQDGGAGAMPHIVKTFGAPDPEMRQALTSIATLKGDAFVPLLNRVEQFATDPVLKRMFSVRHGTVDFGKIIEPGHQTIVRISPLNMPHHVQPLAMQAFILKLWFTIQERANRVKNEKERTQVVLALDEFQIVKDLQVLQLMLEQARSLGLGLVLSHQTTEQISDRQLGIISGNSGTQMVGRVNGRDASRIAQIWDPQFQRELTHQLASQEYFHWTVREKAQSKKEQSPPIQFWLSPPPDLLLGDDAYDGYVRGQLARYGSGVVGTNAIAEDDEKKNRWLRSIAVEFPTRHRWTIMCLLRRMPMRQSEMVDAMGLQNRTEIVPILQGLEDDGMIARVDPGRTSPYELTRKCTDTYFTFDYGTIGTARDIPEVARKAVEGYVEKGLFVTIASQRIRKGQDRTDLVAYDYGREVPISVEIESSSEVQSHPEHVRYNMTKWAALGFGECHVWSANPRIRQIRNKLAEKEKEGVSVIVT